MLYDRARRDACGNVFARGGANLERGGGIDGDWTDPANWAGGVAPVSGGATDLTFGVNGNGFDPTNPTAGFTLHVITLNDGFTQTITGQSLIARGADPNFVTNSNSDLTIANDIAIIDDGGGFQGLFVTGTGTGSLTLSGDLSELEPGSRFRTNVNTTAILSGTNSYTGFTDLLAGSTLIAANDFALGASTGVTRVNNGTTLGLQGNINLQEQLIQITGSGVGGNGGLRNLSGNNTVLGAVAIAGARIQSDAGILTLSGGISGVDADVTFGGAGGIVVSSVIATGAGSVTIDSGTTTFSAANTYTGGTFLNGGVLSVSSVNHLGGAASALTFDGGTLRNTAIIGTSRGVTINAGGGTFQTDADLTLLDAIGGAGTLTKTGTAALILNGDSSAFAGDTSVEEGALTVNNSLCGQVNVLAGGRLQGTGTVCDTVAVAGGTVAPGVNSIDTLTVNGPFTLQPGAIFEVDVDAAGQSDLVIVNGAVNLTDSILQVLAANETYNPTTDYLIIDNDGADAVVGQFAQVTTNFAFLTPTVLYDAGDGNDVVLTLVKSATFTSITETSNEKSVAEALEKFPTDSELSVALLNQTVAGALQAFNALSGEIHATLPGVLANDSRYVREAILGRLMQASYTEEGELASLGVAGPQVATREANAMALGYADDAALDSAFPGYGPGLVFWTRGFGAWGDFDGNRNAATADRNLGGFVSGMDTRLSGTWRAGLATGASYSDITVADRNSSAEVESYHLAGYTGGMAGPLALRGGGAWSWNEIDTSRAVLFPGFFERQKASYDSDTGQIFGEVAIPSRMGGIAFEPFAGLAHVSVETDSFRESGGNLAGLRGSANDQDVNYSTLGLRAATTWHWNSMIVTPHVSAAWRHAFDDVTPSAALAFSTTGIGFGVTGVPLAEDTALIDAGLDFRLGPNTTAAISYSGQFGDKVADNAVKGRLTWLF